MDVASDDEKLQQLGRIEDAIAQFKPDNQREKLRKMVSVILKTVDFEEVRAHLRKEHRVSVPITLPNENVARGFTKTTLDTDQAYSLLLKQI